jgi:hypothetical protein
MPRCACIAHKAGTRCWGHAHTTRTPRAHHAHTHTHTHTHTREYTHTHNRSCTYVQAHAHAHTRHVLFSGCAQLSTMHLEGHVSMNRLSCTFPHPTYMRTLGHSPSIPPCLTQTYSHDAAHKGAKPCYYAWRGAITLEAQQYPDAVHQHSFPSVVLEPGRDYEQRTVYRFSS